MCHLNIHVCYDFQQFCKHWTNTVELQVLHSTVQFPEPGIENWTVSTNVNLVNIKGHMTSSSGSAEENIYPKCCWCLGINFSNYYLKYQEKK